MQSIHRGLSRTELDARVREIRLLSWRRRSVAAIVAAALAAGTVAPAIAIAEPGGWGPSESSSVSSPSDAADAAGPSSPSSGGGISSPSDAADAAGPSSSSDSGGWDGSIGSSSPSSQESNDGGSISSPTEAADAVGGSDVAAAAESAADTTSETPATTAVGDVGGGYTTSVDTATDDAGEVSSPIEAADAVGGSDVAAAEKTDAAAPVDTADDASGAGDYAGPYGGTPATSEDTISSPTEAADAAPADEGTEIGPTSPSSQEDTGPAVTPMGDIGLPAEPSHAPAQSNTRTSTTTTNDEDDEPAYEGPTYTPMGDVAAPGTESYTAPETTTTTTESPAAYTPMGDYAGPYDAPAESPADEPTEAEDTTTTPVDTYDGPVYTPMGDVAMPGAESTVPAGPAPTYAGDDGFEVSVTGAWGLGGTLGFARDGKDTAVTFGIAEGVGLFGSAGEGDAPEESSFQGTAMGSIGPFGLSLEAGTSGITGQFDRSIDANPMVSQTFSNSLTFDEEGFSTDESESMSFGMTEGAVVTYTVTLSIPNETLDMVANWFGLGPQSAIRNGGW